MSTSISDTAKLMAESQGRTIAIELILSQLITIQCAERPDASTELKNIFGTFKSTLANIVEQAPVSTQGVSANVALEYTTAMRAAADSIFDNVLQYSLASIEGADDSRDKGA